MSGPFPVRSPPALPVLPPGGAARHSPQHCVWEGAGNWHLSWKGHSMEGLAWAVETLMRGARMWWP